VINIIRAKSIAAHMDRIENEGRKEEGRKEGRGVGFEKRNE
jgi:hypothetical protein